MYYYGLSMNSNGKLHLCNPTYYLLFDAIFIPSVISIDWCFKRNVSILDLFLIFCSLNWYVFTSKYKIINKVFIVKYVKICYIYFTCMGPSYLYGSRCGVCHCLCRWSFSRQYNGRHFKVDIAIADDVYALTQYFTYIRKMLNFKIIIK